MVSMATEKKPESGTSRAKYLILRTPFCATQLPGCCLANKSTRCWCSQVQFG